MDIELAKQTLLARRAELTAHLHAVEDQLDEPPSKDWEDRSAERQGDEVLEALGAQELAEVHQIDAALARVEAGTYGRVCQMRWRDCRGASGAPSGHAALCGLRAVATDMARGCV